jgi:hypothetical protein
MSRGLLNENEVKLLDQGPNSIFFRASPRSWAVIKFGWRSEKDCSLNGWYVTHAELLWLPLNFKSVPLTRMSSIKLWATFTPMTEAIIQRNFAQQMQSKNIAPAPGPRQQALARELPTIKSQRFAEAKLWCNELLQQKKLLISPIPYSQTHTLGASIDNAVAIRASLATVLQLCKIFHCGDPLATQINRMYVAAPV